MGMEDTLDMILSNLGSMMNCSTCGEVMNSRKRIRCSTCNRISHESCMVALPMRSQSAHVCRECLGRYVEQRREHDHSQYLLEQARRNVEWNRRSESTRNAGATIHSFTQGFVQLPLQFARGAITGNSFTPLAQVRSAQQIQSRRDLAPEDVGRLREGRRQQVMLQSQGVHQGQTHPAAASRAFEQSGVTVSAAELTDLRAEMNRMQGEIQTLRQEGIPFSRGLPR